MQDLRALRLIDDQFKRLQVAPGLVKNVKQLGAGNGGARKTLVQFPRMSGKGKKKEEEPADFRFIDRKLTTFLTNARRKELICKNSNTPNPASLACLTRSKS